MRALPALRGSVCLCSCLCARVYACAYLLACVRMGADFPTAIMCLIRYDLHDPRALGAASAIHDAVMNSPTFRGINARCNHARLRMMHFVQNLQYYLMFEVLEASWKTFEDDLRAADDLDTVIASHVQYLENMLVGALLGDEPTPEGGGPPDSPHGVCPCLILLPAWACGIL